MDQLILPLVPFASENCCHLSLLSTLFHAEVSDKLNRQLFCKKLPFWAMVLVSFCSNLKG